MNAPAIIWFRDDLRLSDNAALRAACDSGRPLLPVYIHTPQPADDDGRRIGGAGAWWLHESLIALDKSLKAKGGRLILRTGQAEKQIAALTEETGAGALYFSAAPTPWGQAEEKRIAETMGGALDIHCREGYLLHRPGTFRTQNGDLYKVFTPFFRAFMADQEIGEPLQAPTQIRFYADTPRSDRLDDWKLQPKKPDWAAGFRDTWRPGEDGAQAALDRFIESGLSDYADQRDRPGRNGTSSLSPHLRFGEISPRRLWHRVRLAAARDSADEKGADAYLRELIWRDFSYTLLAQAPDLHEAPFRSEYSRFSWRDDDAALSAWQKGRTGYPIVDAGMRQLWQTGWMHNRVRMITASFLSKHLLIPWQAGERWFWDTLVDADPASNPANWQWVAGCGADAAPYFRIFNPVRQGERFDPDGDYVRKWVPEIAALPNRFIHAPWTAPQDLIEDAKREPGGDYPPPLVDHNAARQRALEAYRSFKNR